MKILRLLFFVFALGLLPMMFLNSCSKDNVKPPQDSSMNDEEGNDDGNNDNDSGDDSNDEGNNDDGNNDEDDGNDDGDGNNNDDDGVAKEYPYISEVALFIFDGDDPLSDANPLFSYTNDISVVLNPANSCQLKIGKDERSDGTVWELNLLTYNTSLVTKNTCFSQLFEITADDFNSSSSWRVALNQPGTYIPDKYSTRKWDSGQGSIQVSPSESFYTDPNYGTLPKRVTFTFNNVRVGYWDDKGDKKALRVHGVVEVTKHD